MLIQIDPDEKKKLVQQTIDSLQYCDGFKRDLERLLSKYKPQEDVKFTSNPTEFKFSLDKAIP